MVFAARRPGRAEEEGVARPLGAQALVQQDVGVDAVVEQPAAAERRWSRPVPVTSYEKPTRGWTAPVNGRRSERPVGDVPLGVEERVLPHEGADRVADDLRRAEAVVEGVRLVVQRTPRLSVSRLPIVQSSCTYRPSCVLLSRMIPLPISSVALTGVPSPRPAGAPWPSGRKRNSGISLLRLSMS
jgi:hypothetical protein